MSSITMIAKLSKADQTRMKESAGLGKAGIRSDWRLQVGGARAV